MDKEVWTRLVNMTSSSDPPGVYLEPQPKETSPVWLVVPLPFSVDRAP